MRDHIDFSLMKSISDSCRSDRATRGDVEKHALLAALAANCSGGCIKACRYSPALHRELSKRREATGLRCLSCRDVILGNNLKHLPRAARRAGGSLTGLVSRFHAGHGFSLRSLEYFHRSTT